MVFVKPILSKSPQEQGFPFIIWTTKLVMQLIQMLYNVSYKPDQVRRILHSLGHLTQNISFMSLQRRNGGVFKRFVKRLICIFKKLVIVIDQGPYHTSHEMQKFYECNKERLHVVYFPAYSPELDPTEQSWRAAKKWLATRYWENKSQMKEQLVIAFEQNIVRVPIYDYLNT